MTAGGAKPKKLVLTVIDAMKPAMLDRAVATGRAPALKFLIENGSLVDDCVAAFPSVTPVCAASIATGVGPDEHNIPSMNWYHRGESRYVDVYVRTSDGWKAVSAQITRPARAS